MRVYWQKRGLSLVIMLLALLVIFPTLASAASPFKDVKTNHPAYSAIEWAYKQGLIKGYADRTFKPNGILTEAQFVALLVRFDCSAGNSSDAYRYMRSNNIPLNGYTNTKLRNKPITKGQVARVIAAFQGADLSETNAVNYMYKNNLATGATGKNDYNDYGAKLSMTRADAAEFFKRLSKYGDCSMVGLSGNANGSGDGKVPPNFTGDETVFFPKPEKDPNPPTTKPTSSQLVALDIEKSTLIANGVDSTFVSVSLKTCSGQPISYEESLAFSVTSKVGAKIDNGKFGAPILGSSQSVGEVEKRVSTARDSANIAWEIVEITKSEINSFTINDDDYPEKEDNFSATIKVAAVATATKSVAAEMNLGTEKDYMALEKKLKEATQIARAADTEVEAALANLASVRAGISTIPIARQSTSSTSNSDGPDLIVKITAPQVTTAQSDTLSFQVNGKGNPNLNCYTKPVTAELSYLPQAELRVEIGGFYNNYGEYGQFNGTLPANETRVRVTATIVRPGGEVIKNYNGRVRFRSAEGAALSAEYAYFSNGIASVDLTSIWSTEQILDEVTAEIVDADPRYKDAVATVANTTHGRKVAYDPPLYSENSCSNDAEVAFIIDSSASMEKNDPKRERVTKTKEFLDAMGSSTALASRFNARGSLLSPPQQAYYVRPTIDNVGQSGGTNIADGMDVAFRNFSGYNPKVAILLTDGHSNENKILEVLKKAHAQGITIHTIGLGSEKNLNEELLKKLAYDTDGHYYHVADSADLGAAYQSILADVNCGIPAWTCTSASQMFRSPTLERTQSAFFISTFVNERCGDVARVVLRFNSFEGDIDYDLIPRGQGLFALTKEINEIKNFDLYTEGVFIAFDRSGRELPGQRYVKMEIRK